MSIFLQLIVIVKKMGTAPISACSASYYSPSGEYGVNGLGCGVNYKNGTNSDNHGSV